MHATEEHYNKINRIFLQILGLWPYQQSYWAGIQKVVFLSILLTFILVQLLLFITTQYSTNLLLKVLSFVFPTVFCTIKYCIFIIQADSVKQMFEQNRNNWKLLKNKQEIDLIAKHSYIARLIFIILISIGCFISVTFIILQTLPVIFDFLLPLNDSRPCQLIIITEYFVNQEKYMYVILLHHILAVSVAVFALCSTGGTFITYFLHIYALLNIASYHLENAMNLNMLVISSSTKKKEDSAKEREYLLYRRIVHVVILHRRATEFAKFFTSEFTVGFLILIAVGVTSLSLCLFQFLQSVTLTNKVLDTFIFSCLICIHLIYMFIANYAGQIIIDLGIKVFKATYSGMWYKTSLHIQKMLLFIMQKGVVNITITCGGLFIPSLEGFAALVNSAVSYFLVLHSTR